MKILILSASPVRDAIVDELLKEELEKYGHEVFVRPCLREGRQAALDIQPNTVVMPPIRNPYSRDFVDVLKSWGVGVVSRHTEPSCDWKDFKKMEPQKQHQIFGQYPYVVDAELVWSKDEAEILSRRKVDFKVYPIGATTVDAYKREDVIAKHRNRGAFCEKYKFDPAKKILLICSPWGFADTHPDLHTEDLDAFRKDQEGLQRHLEMIKWLAALKQGDWNILVSIHPGVLRKPYKDACAEFNLPLDAESRSFDLNIHADAMVHAGSTMAINAHLLGIPAWQFGDVNAKEGDSWWGDSEAAISRISPHFTDPEDLYQQILEYKPGTNANLEALTELEEGRFGCMDGRSTIRAAEIIDKIKGEFKFSWPQSPFDYSQLTLIRDIRRIVTPMACGICGRQFYIVNDSWLGEATNLIASRLEPYFKEAPPKEVLEKLFKMQHAEACPWCSARFYRMEKEE